MFTYEIKGPIGESLQVKKSGLHIAFTSGTGVLPLMDLIGHLLFTTMGLNSALGVDPDDCVRPDFKLKLFVSFSSRKETVALELLERIRDYFEHIANPSFELVIRLSTDFEHSNFRWNEDFLKR
jgi:hypothetical protein